MEIDDRISYRIEEDKKLVNLAKLGEQKAYERLMKKYQKSIFGMAKKMNGGNLHDAEEITQEVFIKAFSSIEKYDQKFAFSTWLFKIASNYIIDRMRKSKNIEYSLDIDRDTIETTQDDLADAIFHTKDNQFQLLMREALMKLPENFREILILRYVEEYSYLKIADELEIPLGSVKRKLSKARELLVATLTEIKLNKK